MNAARRRNPPPSGGGGSQKDKIDVAACFLHDPLWADCHSECVIPHWVCVDPTTSASHHVD